MSNQVKVCYHKTCKHKGKPQPISNFSLNGTSADGYKHECKDCIRMLYTNPRYEQLKKDREYLNQFSPF